jgi:hypothetical protein
MNRMNAELEVLRIHSIRIGAAGRDRRIAVTDVTCWQLAVTDVTDAVTDV